MVSAMPVIQVYADGVKAVKCKDHRAAALRASQAAQVAKWVELGQQPEPAAPRICIQCGAPEPAGDRDGEELPCGH